MTKKDCFAYFTGKNGKATCTALKELYCAKEECPYYKTREQRNAEERVRATRAEIKVVKSKRNVISDKERARIIDLYQRGTNMRQIEKDKGITAAYGTICKIIQKWKEGLNNE